MKRLISHLRLSRFLSLLVMSIVASGCASSSIEPDQPPSPLSVAQVRATLAENGSPQIPVDDQVLWGGVILKSENLTDATQVEILGYPLDRRQRPLSAKNAQGRFIALFDGFVEPLDLPVGRSVTVLGSLAETVSGKVGEADYLYPVVSVDQSHLWNPQDLPRAPRISFGVGIKL